MTEATLEFLHLQTHTYVTAFSFPLELSWTFWEHHIEPWGILYSESPLTWIPDWGVSKSQEYSWKSASEIQQTPPVLDPVWCPFGFSSAVKKLFLWDLNKLIMSSCSKVGYYYILFKNIFDPFTTKQIQSRAAKKVGGGLVYLANSRFSTLFFNEFDFLEYYRAYNCSTNFWLPEKLQKTSKIASSRIVADGSESADCLTLKHQPQLAAWLWTDWRTSLSRETSFTKMEKSVVSRGFLQIPVKSHVLGRLTLIWHAKSNLRANLRNIWGRRQVD